MAELLPFTEDESRLLKVLLTPASLSWMRVAMYLLQFLDADMGVNQRGFQSLVSEHLLNEPDVRSMVEHRLRTQVNSRYQAGPKTLASTLYRD